MIHPELRCVSAPQLTAGESSTATPLGPIEILDDTSTYGGALVVAVALCGAAWLTLRLYPSFETFVRGLDDATHLSDTTDERAFAVRRARVGRVTLLLAIMRTVALAIGYAIPG